MGVDDGARLRFGEEPKPDEGWARRRLLLRDEEPAFELSFWCGTCPFLFKRLVGSTETVSLPEVQDRLTRGLDDLDDEVIDCFASLLTAGEYLPLLLEFQPRLARPVEPGDYFAEEQVATWGTGAFWGLPEHPHTPYYRTFQTRVDAEAHLFEFVVPMVPPSWNARERVQDHMRLLADSSRPTAVAVSTLDVCAPAVATRSQDYFAHWGLTHFVLDGHHKLEAAATVARPSSSAVAALGGGEPRGCGAGRARAGASPTVARATRQLRRFCASRPGTGGCCVRSDREPLPWALTPADREEREDHARRLIGERVAGVRYFEIDYHRMARAAPDEVQRGERVVTSPVEWDDPTWKARDFDSVDFGVELTSAQGAVFSAIWEMAGINEGVAFREERLRPKRLVADGAFAIWEVHAASRWPTVITEPVTDVQLCWDRPDSSADLCCHAIELVFGCQLLVLTLGEECDGRFSYQPDDLAVIFDEQTARRLRVGRFAPTSGEL